MTAYVYKKAKKNICCCCWNFPAVKHKQIKSFFLQNIFIPSLFDFRPITMFMFCLVLTPYGFHEHIRRKIKLWVLARDFLYLPLPHILMKMYLKHVAHIYGDVVCIPAELRAAIKIVLFCVSFQGYFYVHSHQSISHIFFSVLILYKFMMISLAFSLFREIFF